MSDKTVIETIKRDGLYEKYMKYKGKYLNLKDQIGGANFNLKDIVEFSKFGEYHTWEGTLSDTWAMVGKKSIAVITNVEMAKILVEMNIFIFYIYFWKIYIKVFREI